VKDLSHNRLIMASQSTSNCDCTKQDKVQRRKMAVERHFPVQHLLHNTTSSWEPLTIVIKLEATTTLPSSVVNATSISSGFYLMLLSLIHSYYVKSSLP